MAKNSVKQLNKRTVLYNSGQTPPFKVLLASALQHMIILLSMGMAVPVTIANAAGLDLRLSGTLLASALFITGLTTILQSSRSRLCGSGYMGFAAADSASISACILAISVGGIPLALGMTIFSGVLGFILSLFVYKLRRFFPAELTGTMIFILGINLIPIAVGKFLGSSGDAEYRSAHFVVSVFTFLVMLACTLFIKRLKPYAVLIGIVSGCVLSAILGLIDFGALNQISNQNILAFPIYPELSYSFDAKVMMPFVVISIATLIDNIGDLSACQSADNPDMKKADWKALGGGIRAISLGNILSGLIGGPMMSTASANIGIATACGITSRKVAYLTGGMLALLSFFPGITSFFALMPLPVLGATLLYSGCYIMAGGFSVLSECVLDDKKIFSVFLSISFAISTLIPDLYAFLPEAISDIFVSPMVMGVSVLLITTFANRIGTKKVFAFESAIAPSHIIVLNEEIERVCSQKKAERKLIRKIQISVDSLCESIYEVVPDARMQITIKFDSQQLCIHAESRNGNFPQDFLRVDDSPEKTSDICLMILDNIYDSVETHVSDGKFTIDLAVEL